MALSTILFDFDYTLADSSRGVIESANFALSRLGLPIASPKQIRETIGLSLPDTFSRLAGPAHRDRTDDFVRLFVQRADQVMAGLTVLYPSVPATIRRLRERHIALGIVSTKYRYRIESVLKREDLLACFDAIVGGEDVSRPKPDPQGLYLALDRLGSSPKHTLYIGDSAVDAETAHRASVRFVAVLSGVTCLEAYREYDTWQVLEHVGELPEVLE